MEPQIIDHYNEMPSGINVIDNMNEELAELLKENEELKKENKLLDKYRQPYFKVNTVEEYNEFSKSFEKLTKKIIEILNDEDNGLITIFKASEKAPIPWNVSSLYDSYRYGCQEIHYKAYPNKITDITDKLIEE